MEVGDDEDDETVLALIRAAREASTYRRLALECPAHERRFTAVADAISRGVETLCAELLAREVEGPRGLKA